MTVGRQTRIVAFSALAAAALLVVGCNGSGESPSTGGRVTVVASIFPLADAARQVGGEHVAVFTLLPPGQTPHGFQPRPRQVERVAQARLLLTIGLGMDVWAESAAKAAGRSELAILELSTAVNAAPIKVEPHGHKERDRKHGEDAGHEGTEHEDEHHEAQPHHRTAGDPHLWLDPVLMKAYVRALADELARIDPAHAADYRTRRDAYSTELDRLDADYRRTLGSARIKAFVSFHSAFTYTAERYGLKQAAVFHAERGGIGPKDLEAVIDFVKTNGIKVLFAEPQFPLDRLTPLVEQTGATVKTLDPLGNPNVPGRDSYVALMRSNLAVLAEALESADAP